jgi:hypothetical protein
MVVGEISKDYADMIFDEKDGQTGTRPLKPEVAKVVGRLLYVDDPNAIKTFNGRTVLTRLVTANKTVVFSVYGLNIGDDKVDIYVGGSYVAPGPVSAIDKKDQEKIGKGIFELLSAYINIKNKQPYRDLSKELIKTPLPVDVNRLIGEMAYGEIPPPAIVTEKFGGKRRTRKGKKSTKKSRKLRKLRKTRGRKH